MSKDTADDLSTLEELAVVVQEVVEEALPVAQQEETELRDLERMVRGAMNRVGGCLLELLMGACWSEEPDTVACRCGGTAMFERHREGTVMTTMGQAKVRRAYYLCPECHRGTYPLDERLRFCAGGWSAALQDALALTGVHLPFRDG